MAFYWVYPQNIFSRMEIAFLVFLTAVTFVISWLSFGHEFTVALALASLFLGIYVLMADWVQKALQTKHIYQLGSHLHITRMRRNSVRKDTIPVKEIVHHKIDRLLHGGYVLTGEGKKHLLFFNNAKEIDKVEKLLGRHP